MHIYIYKHYSHTCEQYDVNIDTVGHILHPSTIELLLMPNQNSINLTIILRMSLTIGPLAF